MEVYDEVSKHEKIPISKDNLDGLILFGDYYTGHIYRKGRKFSGLLQTAHFHIFLRKAKILIKFDGQMIFFT